MRLEKVLTYQKGKSPQKDFVSDNLILYLTPEYLRGNGSPNFIPDFPSKVQVIDGDLLLLWDGSNAGEFFKGKNGYLSSTMVKFQFNEEEYQREFLFYQLKAFEGYLKSQTNGSGIPHVDRELLLSIEIKKFNKVEQIRISQILSKSDSAIAKTEALIAKYQRIKTGLMQDLLTKGIDENGNLRNEQTHLFKTEKGLRVPEEWETSTVKNICSLRRGASPRPIEDPIYFSDSGRGWIRISDVTSSYKYLTHTEQYLSKYGVNASVKVNPGDLIMSICATIGKPVILGIEACIHDGFVYFDKLIEEINTEYLFYYLHYIEEKIKEMKQTGTQGNLNTGIVNNIIIAKPSKAEQDSIVKILVGVDKLITQNINELYKLKLQKNGLMQDLLKGIVRVKTQDKETT